MVNEGKLEPKPGCDAAQTLEANVCMKELHWRNSPLIMSQCGSKGSAINISQMIACVGQQSVGGCRAPNGFIDSSLPHFHRGLKTPAHGTPSIMGIEGIDGRRTWSNHVMEMEQILGIEAARKCIIDEIAQTVEHHGMTIDRRHMMLLGDVMTFRGEVFGITRFGIQKMDKSILMLASFERTADHLFNAAVNGRHDKNEGVT
ncbi:DNA-directed RNA polymerase [Theobroma cacao]|uniref:DNA-directed RNA polymerase n=1 Tax=Theobroma cacao TaxID=3641 RepID=A0A061GYE8_THECC|nr:DNA-directed RNA polymerase [Theobroma cacao]